VGRAADRRTRRSPHAPPLDPGRARRGCARTRLGASAGSKACARHKAEAGARASRRAAGTSGSPCRAGSSGIAAAGSHLSSDPTREPTVRADASACRSTAAAGTRSLFAAEAAP
jgi:hypothetical protein